MTDRPYPCLGPSVFRENRMSALGDRTSSVAGYLLSGRAETKSVVRVIQSEQTGHSPAQILIFASITKSNPENAMFAINRLVESKNDWQYEDSFLYHTESSAALPLADTSRWARSFYPMLPVEGQCALVTRDSGKRFFS